jgi:hypothetical protein
MALSPPLTLSDADKLDALQRLDKFRQWHSLDDKRYCLVCDRIIVGREIRVTNGTRGSGPLQLSCPTERCNSIPMDWVLPTDEILARAETIADKERNVAMPTSAERGDAEHGLASRLRKFVLHLKLAS